MPTDCHKFRIKDTPEPVSHFREFFLHIKAVQKQQIDEVVRQIPTAQISEEPSNWLARATELEEIKEYKGW